MGLNEQLKADLDTGRTKFASAATELQTIKDEIDQVTQNLSPEEEKWVGEASPDCQETLHAFDDASSDAITAMGDTSDALKQMRQGIIDAEEEAERDAKKEEIANDVILVLSVVYLPLAGEAAGGTLDAGTASKAIQMIIDLDKKIADIFKRIAAAMKKLGKEFKTDLPEVPKIEPIKVDPIVQSPPGEISPPNVPDSKPAPTPEEGAPVQTPEAASPVEQPNTPNVTNNEATPLNEPEVPPPTENEEPPQGAENEEPPPPVDKQEPHPPAENKEPPPPETPVKEPKKPRPDSGFFDGPFDMPGKPGESPAELPKEIAPRDPITVYTVHTDIPNPEFSADPVTGDTTLTVHGTDSSTTTVIDPAGNSITTVIDAEGNTTVTHTMTTVDENGITTTQTTIDQFGNSTETVTYPHGNTQVTEIDITTGDTTVTDTYTDPLTGNQVEITSVKDVLGNVQTLQKETIVDTNVAGDTTVTEITTETTTDPAGNYTQKETTEVTHPDGSTEVTTKTTTKVFDPANNTTTVTVTLNDGTTVVEVRTPHTIEKHVYPPASRTEGSGSSMLDTPSTLGTPEPGPSGPPEPGPGPSGPPQPPRPNDSPPQAPPSIKGKERAW